MILDLDVVDKENVVIKLRFDLVSSVDFFMFILNFLLLFLLLEVEVMDKEVEDFMNDSDEESDLIGSVLELSSFFDFEKLELMSKWKWEKERDLLEDDDELVGKKVKFDDDDDDG